MADIPPGFQSLPTESPFNQSVGPYYALERDGGLTLGLRIEQRHCNTAGRLHGAMICAIADIALGHNVALAQARRQNIDVAAARASSERVPRAPIATVSLNTDFVGTAREGDWIEVHVDVQKTGRRLAFANAYVQRGDERIARVSAVFTVLEPMPPGPSGTA